MTLNLGNSPAANVTDSKILSPMNKVHLKTPSFGPKLICCQNSTTDTRTITGRGNHSRSPNPIVICLTRQYSRSKNRWEYLRACTLSLRDGFPPEATPVSYLLSRRCPLVGEQHTAHVSVVMAETAATTKRTIWFNHLVSQSHHGEGGRGCCVDHQIKGLTLKFHYTADSE